LLKSPGIAILFLCAVALVAGCGGSGSSPSTLPAATTTPTAAPTPQSGSNSVTFTAQAGSQTVTLPSTGGITGTVSVPGITVTSGSLPTLTATFVTGSDATLTKRRATTLSGGPYLAEIQITAPITFTFTATPGFSLNVSPWDSNVPNGSYSVVVDDTSTGQTQVFTPVTSSNNVLTFGGGSTSLTIDAGNSLTIGVEAASSPAPTPNVTATPSPAATASPTAAPTSAASATECVTGATWTYTSTGSDTPNQLASGASGCGLDNTVPEQVELGENSATTTVTYNVWNGAPHGIVLASSAVTNPKVVFALELTGDGTTTFAESATSGGLFLSLNYLATASEISGTGTYYWGYCQENSATSPTGCASGTTTADQTVSVLASAGSDTSVDTSVISTGSFVFGSAPYLFEIYTSASGAAMQKR
jgi:hypothetical protein